MTTMEGWAGIILTTYFSPGTVGLTILGICVCDLITGSLLGLKITRYLKGARDEDDFPELEALIKSGKKVPFSMSRWALWAEKVAVMYILVLGSELFRLWIAHDKPWAVPGLGFCFGAIYFVLLFTNFRSVIRNVALITENRMLLTLWTFLGVHGDASLEAMLRLRAQKKVEVNAPAVVVNVTKPEEPTIPGSP